MVRRRYFVDSDMGGKRIENYVGDGPCVVLAASDLGSVGAAVRLESVTFCVVEWTGSRPASMLIGAPLTDGSPFVRPFSRRICRSACNEGRDERKRQVFEGLIAHVLAVPDIP